MTTTRDLTSEEAAAVAAFAAYYGRRWKSTLAEVYWYNGRLWRGPWGDDANIGSILHGLRNSPQWNHQGLDSYKLHRA